MDTVTGADTGGGMLADMTADILVDMPADMLADPHIAGVCGVQTTIASFFGRFVQRRTR